MAEHQAERRFAAHKLSVWAHGIVGGLIAGILFLLLLMIISAIQDDGFWRPAELFGSIWYTSLETGTGMIILGLATVGVVSVVLGLLYSYLLEYIHLEPVVSGLIYGAVTWAFLGVLVLSQAFGHVYEGFTIWALLVSYLLYGLGLGVFEEWADRYWVHEVPERMTTTGPAAGLR
jgi:hypothetical protein